MRKWLRKFLDLFKSKKRPAKRVKYTTGTKRFDNKRWDGDNLSRSHRSDDYLYAASSMNSTFGACSHTSWTSSGSDSGSSSCSCD